MNCSERSHRPYPQEFRMDKEEFTSLDQRQQPDLRCQQVKDFTPRHENEDVNLIFTNRVPMNVDGDPRTFSDPNEASGPVSLSNELGAIIDTSHSEDGKYRYDIVIKKRAEGRMMCRPTFPNLFCSNAL